MKRNPILSSMLTWALLPLTAAMLAAVPVGTTFLYQGRLDDGGSPADGLYDFAFRLYDADVGGSQIAAAQFANDVDVLNGLFSTTIDFGAAAFNSEARWLEIRVRIGSSTGGYTTLTPRQRIHAAPVALKSLNDASWNASGANIVNTNAGNVGVNEPSPLARLHVTGNASLGSGFDTADLSTEQFVIEAGQAWLGLYSDHVGAPASGITLGEVDTGTGLTTKWSIVQRTLANGGDLSFTYGADAIPNLNARYLQIKPNGNVGINEDNPAARMHLRAEGAVPFERPNALRVTSVYPLTLANTTEFLDLKGNQIHAVQDNVFSTLALQPDGGNVSVGADSNSDARFHVRRSAVGMFNSDLQFEDVLIEDSANAWLGLYSDNVGNVGSGIVFAEKAPNSAVTPKKWAIYARTEANVGDLVVTYGSDVNPTANEKLFQIDPDGTTKVKVLEILGADVAERFPCSEPVEPGHVVMIDAANPGRLCLARGAYNHKVAGVVSGAGNVPVGAILGNMPGHEDAPAVALSGRVWVKCDASQNGIEPGDLITTADEPGFAMKAADRAKAGGATIGKAMTALTLGEKGMVLVLVNLQ